MDLVGDDFFEKNALFFLHLNIFQMYNFQQSIHFDSYNKLHI